MINLTIKTDYIRIETANNTYKISATSNSRYEIEFLYKSEYKTTRVAFTCPASEHQVIMNAVIYHPNDVDAFFERLADKHNQIGKKRLLEILKETQKNNTGIANEV